MVACKHGASRSRRLLNRRLSRKNDAKCHPASVQRYAHCVRAGTGRPHDGEQPDAGSGEGHELGPQPPGSTIHDGGAQIREIVETSSSLAVIVSEIEIQKHEDKVFRVNAEGPIRLAQSATLTGPRKPVETFVPFNRGLQYLLGLVRWASPLRASSSGFQSISRKYPVCVGCAKTDHVPRRVGSRASTRAPIFSISWGRLRKS